MHFVRTATAALSLCGLLAANCAWSQTATRIEWEDHAQNPTSVTAHLSYDGSHIDDNFISNLSHSHGYSFSSDQLWDNPCSNNAAAQLSGHWAEPGAGTELVFAGTGITVRLLAYGGGIGATWKLLSANDIVVTSGECTNYNDTWENRDLEIAAPGSLPYGLYKMHFNVNPNNTNTSFLIDYAEVSGCGLQRIEETSTLLLRQGTWIDNDVSTCFSGGTQTVAGTAAWSRESGATMTVWFMGKDVGFVSTRNDTCYTDGTGKVSWSIDDGATTGSVDLSSPTYAGGWYDTRVCSILASNLASGVAHKLEVRVASDNANRLVWIDAFDTSGAFIAEPAASAQDWELY